MLRCHKLGMWCPPVKACHRSVHKERLLFGLDELSRRPEARRYRDTARQSKASTERGSRASSVRTLVPAPVLRHPPKAAPGFAIQLAGNPESFGRGTETSSAGSIDDPSSIPQSSHSENPAIVRDVEPRRPGAICAARQIHAQPNDRSAHQSTCATRLVPMRFAPAHPGSSRSWRGTRRCVAVPRLSRDGVPPCLCRNTAVAPPYVTRPPTGCRPCGSRSSRSHDRRVR